ncbi:hypothetical protein BCVP_CDS0058 [Bacillus phage BC-VP]|nr:hypothetical protein BCVP_CDS0058 [Bacillus phage BC-VP]
MIFVLYPCLYFTIRIQCEQLNVPPYFKFLSYFKPLIRKGLSYFLT